MMDTIIVDDEPIARSRLRALCADLADRVRVVGEAGDGMAALDLIRIAAPQLILLDIAMPELGGVEVARALAAMPTPPAVIFCTAHPDRALDAFAVSAADYLLKPVSRARFAHAVDRAAKLLEYSRPSGSQTATFLDHLWVPHQEAMIRIDLNDVDRIDAEGDYVRLATASASHLLHLPLTRLEERLDPDCFVRIRRSTIVRIDLLRAAHHLGAGAWTVTLADGATLRAGPTYWKALKARLRKAADEQRSPAA